MLLLTNFVIFQFLHAYTLRKPLEIKLKTDGMTIDAFKRTFCVNSE